MNVLITGGMGFIGLNLCKSLLAFGHKVRVLDREDRNVFKEVDFVQGDFTNELPYGKVLSDIDIVYHLVCTTVPASSNQNKISDVRSNLIGSLNLLEAVACSNVKKLIFLSSGGTVYGNVGGQSIDEYSSTNPISSYGIHKLAIEKYLYLYFCEYGLDYTIVRLANPYGEGQLGKNGQGIIPIFLKKIKDKQKISIWGDGSAVRDYIYITDVIEALNKILDYHGNERIFNIGSGKGYSILQIINMISELIGTQPEIEFLPERRIDVGYNVLDIRRASKELGWSPKTELKEGILSLI